jgi:hypothetical protein
MSKHRLSARRGRPLTGQNRKTGPLYAKTTKTQCNTVMQRGAKAPPSTTKVTTSSRSGGGGVQLQTDSQRSPNREKEKKNGNTGERVLDNHVWIAMSRSHCTLFCTATCLSLFTNR